MKTCHDSRQTPSDENIKLNFCILAGAFQISPTILKGLLISLTGGQELHPEAKEGPCQVLERGAGS